MNPNLKRDIVHLMDNRNLLDSESFSELLGEIFGPLNVSWELGPDPANSDIKILSFSLLQSESNIKLIEEVVEPPLTGKGWRVVLGIPPRNWERYFEYVGCSHTYKIEGKDWKFKLIGDHEAEKKILLNPSANLNTKDVETIAKILLIGELGELNLQCYISSFTLSRDVDCAFSDWYTLRKEFAKTFPNCHYRDFFLDF